MDDDAQRAPDTQADLQTEPSEAEQNPAPWIVVALIVAAVLTCFSQIATLKPATLAAADARSKLEADYGVWQPMVLPPINPAILEDIRRNEGLPAQLIVEGNYWVMGAQTSPMFVAASATPSPSITPTQPFIPPPATPVSKLPTQRPSATPRAAPPPTRTQPVVPPRTRPSATPRPTWTPITETPYTSIPPTPTRTSTPTHTPTQTNTPTRTPTPTHTPPLPPPPNPTNTTAPTPPPPPPPTNTPTNTVTPTPVGSIEEGTPNGTIEEITCGDSRVIIFGDSRTISSMVFYEYYNEADCHDENNEPGICLDRIEFYLGDSPYIPGTPIPLQATPIFIWGDTNASNNGLIWPEQVGSNGEEVDNEGVASSQLYPAGGSRQTGVCIPVTPGPAPYHYIAIYAPYDDPTISPTPCNDPAQVDSFQLNIDLTLCPYPTPSPTPP